jgi:hypothetical protein
MVSFLLGIDIKGKRKSSHGVLRVLLNTTATTNNPRKVCFQSCSEQN